MDMLENNAKSLVMKLTYYSTVGMLKLAVACIASHNLREITSGMGGRNKRN